MADTYLIVFAEHNPDLPLDKQDYYNNDIWGLGIAKELAADNYDCTDFYPEKPFEADSEKREAAERFLTHLEKDCSLDVNRDDYTFTFDREKFYEGLNKSLADFMARNLEEQEQVCCGYEKASEFFLYKVYAELHRCPLAFNDSGDADYCPYIIDALRTYCGNGKTYRITQVLELELTD